jgi:hypothetical protein
LTLRCSEKTACPGHFAWVLAEDDCDWETELGVGDVLRGFEVGSKNESVLGEFQPEHDCAGMGSPVLDSVLS